MSSGLHAAVRRGDADEVREWLVTASRIDPNDPDAAAAALGHHEGGDESESSHPSSTSGTSSSTSGGDGDEKKKTEGGNVSSSSSPSSSSSSSPSPSSNKELLSALVNKVDFKGRTPLHLAVTGGIRPELVGVLLEYGAEANARYGGSISVLALALEESAVGEPVDGGPVVQQLLAAGASKSVDATTMMSALSKGLWPVAEALYAEGFDLNEPLPDDTDEKRPLHILASLGAGDAVSWTLTKGALVDQKDATGSTPLADAAAKDKAYVINVLLRAGADVNAATPKGVTPLMKAAARDATSAVKALLLAGADVDLTDSDGRTAASRSSQAVRRLLNTTIFSGPGNSGRISPRSGPGDSSPRAGANKSPGALRLPPSPRRGGGNTLARSPRRGRTGSPHSTRSGGSNGSTGASPFAYVGAGRGAPKVLYAAPERSLRDKVFVRVGITALTFLSLTLMFGQILGILSRWVNPELTEGQQLIAAFVENLLIWPLLREVSPGIYILALFLICVFVTAANLSLLLVNPAKVKNTTMALGAFWGVLGTAGLIPIVGSLSTVLRCSCSGGTCNLVYFEGSVCWGFEHLVLGFPTTMVALGFALTAVRFSHVGARIGALERQLKNEGVGSSGSQVLLTVLPVFPLLALTGANDQVVGSEAAAIARARVAGLLTFMAFVVATFEFTQAFPAAISMLVLITISGHAVVYNLHELPWVSWSIVGWFWATAALATDTFVHIVRGTETTVARNILLAALAAGVGVILHWIRVVAFKPHPPLLLTTPAPPTPPVPTSTSPSRLIANEENPNSLTPPASPTAARSLPLPPGTPSPKRRSGDGRPGLTRANASSFTSKGSSGPGPKLRPSTDSRNSTGAAPPRGRPGLTRSSGNSFSSKSSTRSKGSFTFTPPPQTPAPPDSS